MLILVLVFFAHGPQQPASYKDDGKCGRTIAGQKRREIDDNQDDGHYDS